jgi:hypothetical protein
VERARSEAYDWQRAQRLADLEIRSVSQYEQAMAARAYETAAAILNGPGMGVQAREKLVAEHPRRMVQAALQDAIRAAQTPEDLDGVLEAIGKNEFEAPLSSDEQYKFTTAARERQSQIASAQAAAMKRAYEVGRQTIGQKVEDAVARAEESGLPAFTFYGAGELLADERKLPQGLNEEDYNSFMSHLRTGSDKSSESRAPSAQGWALYTKFAEMEPNKGLRGVAITEIYNARAELGSKFPEVMGWWRAAQEKDDKGGAKPPISRPELKDWADLYLIGTLKRDPPGKNEAAANQRLTDLGRINDAVQAWEAREGKAIDPSNFATLLSRTFNEDNDKDNDRAVRVLNAELPRITGRTLVTQQDLDEALAHIEEQTPIVDPAYEAMITSRPLDSGFRAEIYALSQNKTMRPLLEKLIPEGMGVNPKSLVYAAVKALQPPQDVAYEQEQAAKATRAAVSRDAQEAGKEQAAAASAQTAAARAQETAAEKAERDRWNSLPTWEQEAENLTKQTLEDDATAVERGVRAKVMAEDRSAQLAAAKGKGAFGRDAAIMGEWPAGHPRRTALEDRIKAETAVLLTQHAARVASQMDDAKAEYRRFLERVEAKEPKALEQFRTLYLDSFPKWFQLRREGKVQ